jgi:hypothetical protein
MSVLSETMWATGTNVRTYQIQHSNAQDASNRLEPESYLGTVCVS